MSANATAAPVREARAMSTGALLEELRQRGVRLQANGLTLRVDAPAEVATGELLATLQENKRDIIRLFERERLKLKAADRRGLIIRWAKEPGYIALHDPTTGEWHEVTASGCPPWIVDEARAHRRRGRTEA
jgi:hypothetical protein